MKRPVVIQAMQWNGWSQEISDWVGEALIYEEHQTGTAGFWRIATLEGHSYVLTPKDYIIKGVDGEFYPCKPDIFEKTYQMAGL